VIFSNQHNHHFCPPWFLTDENNWMRTKSFKLKPQKLNASLQFFNALTNPTETTKKKPAPFE